MAIKKLFGIFRMTERGWLNATDSISYISATNINYNAVKETDLTPLTREAFETELKAEEYLSKIETVNMCCIIPIYITYNKEQNEKLNHNPTIPDINLRAI